MLLDERHVLCLGLNSIVTLFSGHHCLRQWHPLCFRSSASPAAATLLLPSIIFPHLISYLLPHSIACHSFLLIFDPSAKKRGERRVWRWVTMQERLRVEGRKDVPRFNVHYGGRFQQEGKQGVWVWRRR